MSNIFTPFSIFVISMFVIAWSGPWLVVSLTRIARYLGWREFTVAFFLMAFAGSFPNLSVGITSALQGIPELSFGDVVGGNVVDLSLAVALAVLFSGAALSAEGSTMQTSIFFAAGAALFPLLLIFDGNLSRIDGVLLMAVFFFYLWWLFSKGERFKKVYNQYVEDGRQKDNVIPSEVRRFRDFIGDLGHVAAGAFLLVAGADAAVWSASQFAEVFSLPISIVGILLIGLGNSLPEMYFAIASARKGHTEMILGDLMGSVIVPATFVLGFVVLIHPIEGVDLSPFAVGRAFLIASAILFFVASRTGRKITKKEALVLLGLYIIFVFVEIITK